jgi:hypothetical protein
MQHDAVCDFFKGSTKKEEIKIVAKKQKYGDWYGTKK